MCKVCNCLGHRIVIGELVTSAQNLSKSDKYFCGSMKGDKK